MGQTILSVCEANIYLVKFFTGIEISNKLKYRSHFHMWLAIIAGSVSFSSSSITIREIILTS